MIQNKDRETYIGRYHIIRELGRGGFAIVYLGEHIHLRRLSAIKVLHPGIESSSEDLESFLSEARIIALLEHTNIVRILECDVDERIPYIVMDYAPNGSLNRRHPQGQIIDPSLVIQYIRQIADALQFAHNHHVVHCDVKPENMLLDRHNTVLLSDFGIAVVIHTSLKINTIVGTLRYMAPEQFMGAPCPASDQYSLGIVTYQWLCGYPPFIGKSFSEMQHLHRHMQPPSLRSRVPELPEAVEQVVLKALAKDPQQRFPSVKAFASALEEAIREKSSPNLIAPTPPQSPLPAEITPLLLPTISSLLSPIATRKEAEIPLPSAGRQILPSPARHPSSEFRKGEMHHIPTQIDAQLIYTKHVSWVSSLDWSPDGEYIASGSWDKTVQVWNATSGEIKHIHRGHAKAVKAVAWSPDSEYIASGSWDKTVQVWSVIKGKQLQVHQHAAQVETVICSPSGRCIASAGHDHEIHVWRVETGNTEVIYRGHTGPIWSLTWSPDGKQIASASHDGTVHIWCSQTGKRVQIYRNHTQHCTIVAWSPDGKWIASADRGGVVHIWNPSNKEKLYTYHDPTGIVKALHWSYDGHYIASAVTSVQVRAIHSLVNSILEPPILVYAGHSSWVNALAWIPLPGRYTLASASDDNTVHVWEGTRKQ